MTRYEATCNRLRTYWEARGKQFSPPTGDAFIHAYNEGDTFRVKVRRTFDAGGSRERWGYVAMTGGWQPSFMLMHHRGQRGSSDLLSDTCDTIVDSHYIR